MTFVTFVTFVVCFFTSERKLNWNISQYFTPAEKIENPLAMNLVFGQIRQDTFQKVCVRMTNQEQQKMKAMFGMEFLLAGSGFLVCGTGGFLVFRILWNWRCRFRRADHTNQERR